MKNTEFNWALLLGACIGWIIVGCLSDSGLNDIHVTACWAIIIYEIQRWALIKFLRGPNDN